MSYCDFQPGPDGKFYCTVCDEQQVRPVRCVPNRRNCGKRPARRERTITEPPPEPYKLTIPDGLPPEEEGELQAAIDAADADPTLYQKARHLMRAFGRWVSGGCRCRTAEEAQACRDVCLACPSGKYDADRDACRVCGCKVKARWIPLLSKPELKTEDCPRGHWPK